MFLCFMQQLLQIFSILCAGVRAIRTIAYLFSSVCSFSASFHFIFWTSKMEMEGYVLCC